LYSTILKTARQQHFFMSCQHIFFVVLFIISILYDTVEMRNVKEQPSVRLMNAVHGEVLMPVAGLGTFGYGRPDGSRGEYWGPEQGHNATFAWLKMGGRRLDSADDYRSSDGVGTGWVASGVPRSEIFLTSKVDPYGYNETLEAFAGILTSLQTTYIDLLLIHWPGRGPGSSGPPCLQGQSTWMQCRIQTWKALETIFNTGQVRSFPRFYKS
jgi:diketogulonate reductase-like aldo/keto reductase